MIEQVFELGLYYFSSHRLMEPEYLVKPPKKKHK